MAGACLHKSTTPCPQACFCFRQHMANSLLKQVLCNEAHVIKKNRTFQTGPGLQQTEPAVDQPGGRLALQDCPALSEPRSHRDYEWKSQEARVTGRARGIPSRSHDVRHRHLPFSSGGMWSFPTGRPPSASPEKHNRNVSGHTDTRLETSAF